jgi:hypothetical protein
MLTRRGLRIRLSIAVVLTAAAVTVAGTSSSRGATSFRESSLSFLESLGVDPVKDAEAYHTAQLALGRHVYGGWYHFVGQLIVDDDFGAVDFGDGFTAWLLQPSAPRLEPFKGQSVVQLEFQLENVPWMLSEPEPL